MSINSQDISILQDHLLARCLHPPTPKGYSFVFDVTRDCNLQCTGCGVNAVHKSNNSLGLSNTDLSFTQVISVIEQIASFTEIRNINASINFGGGEPFLRKDMVDIISETRSIMPKAHISIDTNGTILEPIIMEKIAASLSNIGFSLDGLEPTHNHLRDPSGVDSSYSKCVRLINSAISLGVADIVEVTSVATRQNLKELPMLASFLGKLGVKNYSIHRAMPVGRMWHRQFNSIPSAIQYLELYTSMIKSTNNRDQLKFHIHHTLESIYSAILLDQASCNGQSDSGKNINYSTGIDATGEVFTDPWFMFESPSSLSVGSILKGNLHEIISWNNPLYNTFLEISASNTRCGGCAINCTGGSRVCAVATQVDRLDGITIPEFLSKYSATDPACPLHFLKGANYAKRYYKKD
jgi:MoaA/NifB/PqqE/SkfB family radical SAM enzyme